MTGSWEDSHVVLLLLGGRLPNPGATAFDLPGPKIEVTVCKFFSYDWNTRKRKVVLENFS
jgi:hypothetical protein